MSTEIKRSNEDWRELVMECRRSGLSDKAWCEMHGIKISTFYNAISRLRKKACDIPARERKNPVLDLTCSGQEVVAIDIVDETNTSEICTPSNAKSSVIPAMNIEPAYTMEVIVDNAAIRLSNQTDMLMLEKVLKMIRSIKC